MERTAEEVEALNLELLQTTEADWAARVLGWAEDRNLIAGSTPSKQMEKLAEEVMELAGAISRNDPEGIKDGIGDCSVVLRIIARQANFHWDDCLEHAWVEIKDRRGRMVDGIFVKDAG